MLVADTKKTELNLNKIFFIFCSLALITLTMGCSTRKRPKGKPLKELPPIVTRRFALEPTYFKLKTAYLPNPVPRDLPKTSRAIPILPINTVKVRNTPLYTVGEIVARKFGYKMYCASPIAKLRVSLNKTGNIEEIISEIATQKGIITSVNHENRLIQFLTGIQPR